MSHRLPLVLSATALAVALLGATPLGEAARDVASQVPPLAKRANFAKTAGVANNAKRLGGRPASAYARLGRDGKLPPALGATGPQGPAGPAGPKGDTGSQGPRGPNGAGPAFTIAGQAQSVAIPSTMTTVLTLELPAGRYIILGSVHIGQGGGSQYSGICQVVAGNQSDSEAVTGVPNPIVGGVGSSSNLLVSVIHEFTAPGAVLFQCFSPATAPAIQARPQIDAIAVTAP